MNKNYPILLIFCIGIIISFAFAKPTPTVRAQFYAALSSKDTVSINQALKQISLSDVSEKNAFIGTLLMKKAAFEKFMMQKKTTFDKGKKLLEKAILAEPKNTEYRFLRLVIQEQCPAILKYNENIKMDANWVINNYAQTIEPVRDAIMAYAPKSKNLTSIHP